MAARKRGARTPERLERRPAVMKFCSRAHRLLYCPFMKRLFVWWGAGLLAATPLAAQSSIQTLEDDLNEAKTQHDQANSSMMTTFFSTLDAATQSGSVAIDLYQKAGGQMPDLSPVQKHYEYETPTERAAREAIDAQNMATVAVVVQVHCGLMKNAAMLVLQPTAQDVHDQWIAWLKTTASIYPQLSGKRALKEVTMRDSLIGTYLGFHGWGDSEQGGWSIKDLPQLYHDLVLQPLRNPPGPGTLDAWDTYMAMLQADDPDQSHWSQVVEPPLDFDRTADDFAIEPTMDKLQQIDQIIKANPGNDHLDEWIGRARKMIAAYQGGASTHSALPGPTPGTTSSGSDAPSPTASPGATSSGSMAPTPTAAPGTTSSGSTAPTPTAAPGTTSSGSTAPMPTAAPGTPSSGSTAPMPTAAPGTPSSGSTAPTPTASPGTPSSGGTAPTPTATP